MSYSVANDDDLIQFLLSKTPGSQEIPFSSICNSLQLHSRSHSNEFQSTTEFESGSVGWFISFLALENQPIFPNIDQPTPAFESQEMATSMEFPTFFPLENQPIFPNIDQPTLAFESQQMAMSMEFPTFLALEDQPIFPNIDQPTPAFESQEMAMSMEFPTFLDIYPAISEPNLPSISDPSRDMEAELEIYRTRADDTQGVTSKTGSKCPALLPQSPSLPKPPPTHPTEPNNISGRHRISKPTLKEKNKNAMRRHRGRVFDMIETAWALLPPEEKEQYVSKHLRPLRKLQLSINYFTNLQEKYSEVKWKKKKKISLQLQYT